MVSICPHNRNKPVNVDDPCYYCGGRWRIMRLTPDEAADVAAWGDFVVKCRRCGIISMATRQAEAAPSRGASL